MTKSNLKVFGPDEINRVLDSYEKYGSIVGVAEDLAWPLEMVERVLTSRYSMYEIIRRDLDVSTETHLFGLSEADELFCQQYILLNKPDEAYAIAWPTTGMRSGNNAYNKLKHPAIQLRILQIRQQLREHCVINTGRIINEIAKVAFSNVSDIVTFTNNNIVLKDSDQIDCSAIQEVQMTQFGVKIKMYNKLDALNMLCKHLGVITDRVEVSGNADKPIMVSTPVEDLKARIEAMVSKAIDYNTAKPELRTKIEAPSYVTITHSDIIDNNATND